MLRQSFGAFEFLIIDDASTDATPELLRQWAARDARIVVAHNEENLGLTRTLNRGVRLARGRWIARQDADDLSLPDRLAEQMAFLQRNPDVGLLGTAAWVMDEQGVREENPRRQPVTDAEIRWQLLLQNPFFHTSVLVRRALLEAHPYDERLTFGQDFELWGRILGETRGANLAAPLVCSRRHADRVSTVHGERQQEIGRDIAVARLAALLPGREWSGERLQAVRAIARSPRPTREESTRGWLLFLDLFQAFAARSAGLEAALPALRRRILDRFSLALLGSPAVQPQMALFRAAWRVAGWGVVPSLFRIVVRELRRRVAG